MNPVHVRRDTHLRPAWPTPRIRLADVFAAQQRWEEAIPHYRRALASQPKNVRMRLNLGQSLIRLQRYDEARAELERVEQQWDEQQRLDGLRVIGVDEISYRKRHRYLTVVVNHLTGRVVWAACLTRLL